MSEYLSKKLAAVLLKDRIILMLSYLLFHRLSGFLSGDRPQMSGQVLSSHSTVSSSRNIRPYTPLGGPWNGQWRTTWPEVCSSAPHFQAAEGTIPRMQGRKRSTEIRRLLRRTHTLFLTGLFQEGGCWCRGWNYGVS